MVKNAIIIFLLIGLLCVTAILLFPIWHNRSAPASFENGTIKQTLLKLGDSALQTEDVPIAALLIYKNKIVSGGYNSVIRNRNIAEHAEINAINGFVKQIGIDSFRHLDKDQLRLITTWEPCYMCLGALMESNISHIIVLRPKSWKLRWRQQWKRFLFEKQMQFGENDTLQLNLFRRHPGFSKQDTSAI